MRDWRSDELEYTEIWASLFDELQRLHPGRFNTAGDVADTTDAEFLLREGEPASWVRCPACGVEAAKASKISGKKAFEAEFNSGAKHSTSLH